MKERAALIGAQLHISSTIGEGTRITLLWQAPPRRQMRKARWESPYLAAEVPGVTFCILNNFASGLDGIPDSGDNGNRYQVTATR